MEIMTAQQMLTGGINASPQPLEKPSQGSSGKGFEGAMNRALGDDERLRKSSNPAAMSSMKSEKNDSCACADRDQGVGNSSVLSGLDVVSGMAAEQVSAHDLNLDDEPDGSDSESAMNAVMPFVQHETMIPLNKSLDCVKELLSVQGNCISEKPSAGAASLLPQKDDALLVAGLTGASADEETDVLSDNATTDLVDGYEAGHQTLAPEKIASSSDVSVLRDNLQISHASAPDAQASGSGALASGTDVLKTAASSKISGSKAGAVHFQEGFTSNTETEVAEPVSLTDEGLSSGLGFQADAFKHAETGSFEADSFERGSGCQGEGQRNISGIDAGSFAALDPGTQASSSNVSLKAVEAQADSVNHLFADDVFDRFGSGVRLGVGSGMKEVSIALHPEELGSVTIRLKVENSAVTAHIIVDSQSVKGIFDSDTNRLRDIFAQNGLSLESCSVDVGSGRGFGNDASAGEGQGWSAAPGNQARGAYRERQVSDASVPAPARTMRHWADGSVDLFI